MKSTALKAMIAMAVITATVFFGELVGAQCPFTDLTTAKTKLYLYFATSSDATFPEYNDDLQTSPLEPFNVADLDGGIGTTAQLRNSIVNIVKEDYCEFDVEVATTTTAPTPTEARWQIVGFGSDDEIDPDGNDVFGVAQDVDLNNADQQDYARVYAKSFLNAYGGAGDALNGANSTLARWATAIGHTAVHEAGHNFGLTHANSAARPGEDAQNSHIMATGNTGLTGEQRAGTNRHFGDQEYEILGHNIGLKVKTLYNWDFINPNAEEAHSLVLTLLSPAATLTVNWFWNGVTSPWTSPTVAAAGTQSFQGTTYNKYTLTFSTPKAWGGGANGVVPGGAEFHIGATFSEPDLVIVYETRLKDSGGTNLNLHPRLTSFDTGDTDLATGDFNVRAFNPEGNALVVEDLRVALLPRLLSIDSMVAGAEMRDIHNVPIASRQPGRFFNQIRSLDVKESATFRLASFTEARPVDIYYDPTNCKKGFTGGPRRQGTPARPSPKPSGPGDVSVGEIEYCPKGWALSLFPATYVYLTATIVDPNTKYWDKAQAKYVTGPLRSKVFYQFAGKLPDFNKNGVDDLIDIRTNVSKDENKNGIVDESEKGQPTPGPQPHSKKYWWWWWLLIFLLLIFLIWLIWRLRRRRKA